MFANTITTINPKPMKRSIILSVFLFISSMIAKKTLAAERFDSTECLVISGKIETGYFADEEKSNNYKVELIYFNTKIDSVVKKDSRSFKFILRKNSIYTLRITKEGYVPKLISINTFLDNGNQNIYYFQFETDLLRTDTKGIFDPEALEFPIALVGFYEELQAFDFNKEYTSNIKKSMYLISKK